MKRVEYSFKLFEGIPVNEDKFLFFFDPKLMDEKKFLFGLSLKTGVQIFAGIILIQAISTFFDIFSPESFLKFFVNIIAFIVFALAALYAFLSTMNNNFILAKNAYIVTSAVFLVYAIKYICKTLIKVIEFITPWDGDFLQLDFLQYVFGYGALLLIILYFIYVLYHYMLELKNPSPSVPNQDDEMLINEPMQKIE